MKLPLISFFTFLLFAFAIAGPVPGPEPAIVDAFPPAPKPTRIADDSVSTLEKRAAQVTVTASALRYRTCAYADNSRCPAMGQYARGTRVTVACCVRGQAVENGYDIWGKVQSNGYYIYMGLGYVSPWTTGTFQWC